MLQSRAGPFRCRAQCKTKVRGPFERWFYDVIVFSQPCYTTMVGRTYKALARELSTFANVWWQRKVIASSNESVFLLTMRFINRFYCILERKWHLEKVNPPPKHHGAGPPATRGPMQLHRCKAGPAPVQRQR